MTTDDAAFARSPSYTERFWAKAQPYRRLGPDRIHLLEHHLADVGACLEALLAQPTIRSRLARAADRDTLDEHTIARLCVFAALHDIGKVNAGFQTQVWLPADFAGSAPIRRAGHTLDLTPVLTQADTATAAWFFEALGWNELVQWDDQDGAVVSDLLVATLSHHGLPLQLEGELQPNPALWRAFKDLRSRARRSQHREEGVRLVPRRMGCLRAASPRRSGLPTHVSWTVHAGRLARFE